MSNQLIAVELLEWAPFWMRFREGTPLAYHALAAKSRVELLVVPDSAEKAGPDFPFRRYLGASVLRAIGVAVAATASVRLVGDAAGIERLTEWTLLAPLAVAMACIFLPVCQFSLLRTQLRILVPQVDDRIALFSAQASYARRKLWGNTSGVVGGLALVACVAVAMLPAKPRVVQGSVETLERDGYVARRSSGCPKSAARRVHLVLFAKSLGLAPGGSVVVSAPEQQLFRLTTEGGWSVQYRTVAIPMPDDKSLVRKYPVRMEYKLQAQTTLPDLKLEIPYHEVPEVDERVERELGDLFLSIEVSDA